MIHKFKEVFYILIYFLASIITCLLTYCLFPTSLALSNLVGAIDYPSARKSHSTPTARGGGFAFFFSFSLVLIVFPMDLNFKLSLLFGGTFIFLIGFLDDAISISPFMKLSGQFLALAVYHFISEILDYNISIFQGILMAIWIIFITNATNIIDGLDGLASGVCASEALCLGVIALIFENKDIMICSFFLLGAIIGFIPHNFPHAKIFMGDCGALFLGFTLSVMSARLMIEAQSTLCVLAILLIFRIPIYDTNLSIFRRLLKRQNPFQADKNHFHHYLLRHGFTKECASLALISASLFFGFLGIALALI